EGPKEFLKSPKVPNALNADEAVNKSQMDAGDLPGQTAFGWGNFRDYGLGAVATGTSILVPDLTINQPNSFFRIGSSTPGAPTNDAYFAINFGVGTSTGRAILLARQQNNTDDFY